MGKNWLIRTKSNHILGPVSKEKVIELYQNGSIKADDEVCSGNGFWFFIRETDMVEKYLLGDEAQGFNPISEAKDVLTASEPRDREVTRDDITVVGGLNLAALKGEESPAPEKAEAPTPKTSSVTEVGKKKLKFDPQVKVSEIPVTASASKRQDYLKYIGILGFLVLLFLIYFRKDIIRHIFHGEVSWSPRIELIPTAHAQEKITDQKKKLLEDGVVIDEVTFRVETGIEGLRVVSTFDIETLSCKKLENEVLQLGVLLYPAELFNEKFLIKIRDCMVKLDEQHPVKRWLKSLSETGKPNPKEQAKIDFINEMINSQFNLITDLKLKTAVINALSDIPETTVPEKLLKSYFYLMIGNIARSDRILASIINESPRKSYEFANGQRSVYHRLTTTNLDRILGKFSRHPADRLTFGLFNLFALSFYNKADFRKLVEEIQPDSLNKKIELAYTEKIAPELVGHLRLLRMSENRRVHHLLNTKKFPLTMQAYWVWPFMKVDRLSTEVRVDTILKLEKEDPLWAIYLLEDENVIDLYSKRGGQSISQRRQFLRKNLQVEKDFMLTLYKLIELGDIDQELVQKTSSFLIHE